MAEREKGLVLSEDDVGCSSFELRSFLSGRVWEVMKSTLVQRLNMVRDDLETVEDEKERCRLQGRAEKVRFLLMLPDVMLETLKEDDRDGLDTGRT